MTIAFYASGFDRPDLGETRLIEYVAGHDIGDSIGAARQGLPRAPALTV